MKRHLVTAAAVAVVAATILGVGPSPAGAAENIVATSVALDEFANCSNDADLDIGLESDTVAIEGGLASTIGDDDIGSFEQASTLSNFDGVVDAYGIPFVQAQDEGSVIGTWAYVGDSPPTSTNAAEWFVLYRCSDSGDNDVLYTCFGDYGTCPHTAQEAIEVLFTATVSTTAPVPGEVVTVSGSGCFLTTAGAVLTETAGPIVVIDAGAPDASGDFELALPIPPDVSPGTELRLEVGCAEESEPVVLETFFLTVQAPATTTTSPAPTLETRRDTVQPRFTG